MESGRPTALRGELALQEASQRQFRAAQTASAQVRWLRQDIASLTDTVPRIAAARTRISTLLEHALIVAPVTGSTFAESSPPAGNPETRESWAGAAALLTTAEQTKFVPVLWTQASIHIATRQSNSRAHGALVGVPRRYADALVALGLMLIVAAISFTIA